MKKPVKKAVKKPPVKKPVKKQVKKEPTQSQTQRQVVNISIGNKATQRPRVKQTKKSILQSGTTIIMNPHTPQQPLPQQPLPEPMVRQELTNTIHSPLPTYIPEYVGVDNLDDNERNIDPMRAARLNRFMSRVNDLESVSDLTSESYYPPRVPPNSISSDYYLKQKADSVISEPFSNESSIVKPIINNETFEPIQAVEPDVINDMTEEGLNIRRGDNFQMARLVRRAQQHEAGVGSDVPDELLLIGNYGFTQSGGRRTVPTVEQKERLVRLGIPYIRGFNKSKK